MNQYFYFCLGYETDDFTIDFWTENLNLAKNEIALFEDYGFNEFQDELEKFCKEKGISNIHQDLVGLVKSGDMYDSENFTTFLSPEQLQLEISRLEKIFGKKPSIYTGVYYC